MKVLVIESTVFGYDGITNVISNYYIHQDHDKVHMDLVTINPISEDFQKKLNSNGDKNFVFTYRNNNPFKYLLSLRRLIKKEKYDIVHVHGCSATMAVEMLAAKLAGVKVRIAHSHNTKCDHIKIDKFLRPFFYKWCNVNFACGKEAGEWLFQNRQFEVISNGIDLEKFQYSDLIRNQIREEYGIESNFVVGHVGRFSEQKNHIKLINIFEAIAEEHTDAKLVLIGDGELKEKIENQVKDKELNVLFVGVTNEVEKWLQAIDIIVFPSLFEGLPLGLIEAQAAGLPCILSDTISQDTKITDLVRFVNLNGDSKIWSKVVSDNRNAFNRQIRIDEVKRQIKEAHFDIKHNCKELLFKYEALLNDGGLK